MKARLIIFLIQFALLLVGSKKAFPDNFTPKAAFYTGSISKIIHGEDNRIQTYNHEDQAIKNLAKSVAIISNKSKLHHFDESHYIFSAPSLGQKLNLCEGQRFKEEPTLGTCSAFLVAKDLVATAGHCVSKDQGSEEDLASSCRRMRIIFNFTKEELDNNFKITGKAKTLKKKSVYKCKEVIAHKYKKTKYQLKDYAIIKLDRPVENIGPLRIRKHGAPREKTKLITIGHPLGIPQKISGEARIFPFAKEEDENYFQSFLKRRHIFYSNLDTFAGNSGSPVINEDTLKVEGIFIGGDEEDFVFEENSWCRKVKVKPSTKNFVKEYVQRIKLIKRYIK